MNNTITEMKNLIGRFNRRLESTEEKISELEDRAVEFIQSKEQKEKRIKE